MSQENEFGASGDRIRLRGHNGDVDGKIWESKSVFQAGRVATLEIVLDDNSVSRRHAEVHPTPNGWHIRDLGSTNGTFINGTRLGAGEYPIRAHDIVRFGNVTFVVEFAELSHCKMLWHVTVPGNRTPATPAITGGKHAAMNDTVIDGRYSLTKKIGNGSCSEVWLGNDNHGNIPKAIKITSRPLESDESKRELQVQTIINRLNHPYLVRTECFSAEPERFIVVMELADGGSLRDRLKARKESESGLSVEYLLKYTRHAAEALDYLHEEGIFHRNIKPEKILFAGRFAKVAGFGRVCLAPSRQSTKTSFAGAPAYSAPETWKDRVTAKSDQYSLAVTYAELRLGRAVFKGMTTYEYMVAHLQTLPNLNPIPEAEQRVLLRALAKEPGDRFATCREFIEALEAAVATVEPTLMRSTPVVRSPIDKLRLRTGI